ncbi:1630_t:CDS:2 [Funneliformis geosporum]|nr:1630_t:CDS:2 [Funneliformis geosporum]
MYQLRITVLRSIYSPSLQTNNIYRQFFSSTPKLLLLKLKMNSGYLCCGKPELSVMLHGKIEEKDFEIRLRNKLKSHIIKPACWLRLYELESPLEIIMRMLFIFLVINVS